MQEEITTLEGLQAEMNEIIEDNDYCELILPPVYLARPPKAVK